jgi:hypothetical protein
VLPVLAMLLADEAVVREESGHRVVEQFRSFVLSAVEFNSCLGPNSGVPLD